MLPVLKLRYCEPEKGRWIIALGFVRVNVLSPEGGNTIRRCFVVPPPSGLRTDESQELFDIASRLSKWRNFKKRPRGEHREFLTYVSGFKMLVPSIAIVR